MSAVESVCNTVLGIAVSFGAAFVVYPLFGFTAGATAYAGLTAVFTVLSLVRVYIVRRVFEQLRGKI